MITLHDLALRAAAKGITDEEVIRNALQSGELELRDVPRLLEDAAEIGTLWLTYNGRVPDVSQESLRATAQARMEKTLGPDHSSDDTLIYMATQAVRVLREMDQETREEIVDSMRPLPRTPGWWRQLWRRWF